MSFVKGGKVSMNRWRGSALGRHLCTPHHHDLRDVN